MNIDLPSNVPKQSGAVNCCHALGSSILCAAFPVSLFLQGSFLKEQRKKCAHSTHPVGFLSRNKRFLTKKMTANPHNSRK